MNEPSVLVVWLAFSYSKRPLLDWSALMLKAFTLVSILFASTAQMPSIGHLTGRVTMQDEGMLFAFCNGTSVTDSNVWLLSGGGAYDELLEAVTTTETDDNGLVVTLYLNEVSRVDLRKKPGNPYWSVAQVDQIIDKNKDADFSRQCDTA